MNASSSALFRDVIGEKTMTECIKLWENEKKPEDCNNVTHPVPAWNSRIEIIHHHSLKSSFLFASDVSAIHYQLQPKFFFSLFFIFLWKLNSGCFPLCVSAEKAPLW
jgi:hypothetical protein